MILQRRKGAKVPELEVVPRGIDANGLFSARRIPTYGLDRQNDLK